MCIFAVFSYWLCVQGQINQQRQEFWTTRVDGNALMWQAIRSAAEALIANDVGLASAILEASNIITPNGSLELCYDERGHQYKVPLFCLTNPTDLVEGAASAASSNPERITTTPSAKPIPTTRTILAESIPMNIKVRVNPGDINMVIAATTTDSIYDLKKLIYNQSLQVCLRLYIVIFPVMFSPLLMILSCFSWCAECAE